MQTLLPADPPRGRVLFFVPRWIESGLSDVGLPYSVVPVLSALLGRGYAVDFLCEHLDPLDGPAFGAALDRCDALAVWCAELNPGTQIPGLLGALGRAHDRRPEVPRVAGGGFLSLTTQIGLDLAPLAEAVLDGVVIGELPDVLDRRLGIDGSGGRTNSPFRIDALHELDLAPFLRPESMHFGNDEPTLQLPTGAGCSKHCSFCYYEGRGVRLLAAGDLVDAVLALRERYGVRQFLFGELDFLAAKRRALAVARSLIDRGADVRWFALASIQDLARLTDAELDLLVASGCHELETGTEVGGDARLKQFGKAFTADEVVVQTRRLLDRGVLSLHNMLFGIPGETAADRAASLRLVRRLRRQGPGVRFNFRLFQAVPNSPLGRAALEHLPRLPRDLEELAAYRGQVREGRGMPWLSEVDERTVRELTEYFLPLAYDDRLAAGQRPSPLRRALRSLARLRCAAGRFDWPLERGLFEHRERIGLAGTLMR